ncbi:head maturation protease, ClpP-related [Nonomuraea bangladeshensis]|uniref:head maturation protease, ClpP-related n=1 Tax=Nonomuraea bangladeshensis TaxID=404385 RepID=UPI0031CFE379
MDKLDLQSRVKTARPIAKLREGRTDWYRIENSAEGAATVHVYDEIGYFGVTAQDFVRDLQGISADRIELHLNSPGGDVFDGIAIMNALRQHKAQVTVTVDGLAASIASVIAMAGDRVVMARNSQMMIHEASGLSIGNASDMRQMADLLDKVSGNIASVYAERAGGDVEEWRTRMRAETWYSADEAVEAGLADEVHAAPDKSADNTWDLSIYNFAGRAQAPDPVIPAVEPEPAPVAPTPPQFDAEAFVAAMKGAFK